MENDLGFSVATGFAPANYLASQLALLYLTILNGIVRLPAEPRRCIYPTYMDLRYFCLMRGFQISA